MLSHSSSEAGNTVEAPGSEDARSPWMSVRAELNVLELQGSAAARYVALFCTVLGILVLGLMRPRLMDVVILLFVMPCFTMSGVWMCSLAGGSNYWRTPRESSALPWIWLSVIFSWIVGILFVPFLVLLAPVLGSHGERDGKILLAAAAGLLVFVCAVLSHVFFVWYLQAVARFFGGTKAVDEGNRYLVLFFAACAFCIGAAAFGTAQNFEQARHLFPEVYFLPVQLILGLTISIQVCFLVRWYLRLVGHTRELIRIS